MMTLPLWALTLMACADRGLVVAYVPEELAQPFASFGVGLESALRVEPVADPVAALGRGRRVAVVDDLDCGECFRIDAVDGGWEVHGGGRLGAQYGLATLLESGGVRFFHPYDTYIPEDLTLPDEDPLFGEDQLPEQQLRGLHLHTLHPIEGYFDFWEPGDEQLAGAKQVIDWVVKNRGNYLQWVALDNILDSDSDMAAWQDHTASILAEAHARGLETGLGVQLFGSSNLQLAFDLLDEVGSPDEQRAEMQQRLGPVFGELEFDRVSLSFGEFFGEDPDSFIASVNLAGEVMHELRPALDVTTVVHVGADQRVDYDGQSLIYYFLATYADPSITPWVHSVMYYNLFEDAGGAYHHEAFDEHRELLLSRLRDGLPVAYFPESAYWIAFDNSVPTYLPLYVRSRYLDMASLRAEAQAGGFDDLSAHVLFSSGWEWGYWQNDIATLRMGWRLPERYEDFFTWAFADEPGLAEIAAELAELQHQHLLIGRLAPYLASYDNVMELGYNLDIISQPKRVLPEELAEMDATALAAFEADTVAALDQMAADFEALAARLPAAMDEGPAAPWLAETRDGVQITALRARFIATVYAAMVDALQGESPNLTAAEQALSEAEIVVHRRHAAMHDPRGARLIDDHSNDTIYQYGYLLRADELCFWRRELALTQELATGTRPDVPGCSL